MTKTLTKAQIKALHKVADNRSAGHHIRSGNHTDIFTIHHQAGAALVRKGLIRAYCEGTWTCYVINPEGTKVLEDLKASK